MWPFGCGEAQIWSKHVLNQCQLVWRTKAHHQYIIHFNPNLSHIIYDNLNYMPTWTGKPSFKVSSAEESFNSSKGRNELLDLRLCTLLFFRSINISNVVMVFLQWTSACTQLSVLPNKIPFTDHHTRTYQSRLHSVFYSGGLICLILKCQTSNKWWLEPIKGEQTDYPEDNYNIKGKEWVKKFRDF